MSVNISPDNLDRGKAERHVPLPTHPPLETSTTRRTHVPLPTHPPEEPKDPFEKYRPIIGIDGNLNEKELGQKIAERIKYPFLDGPVHFHQSITSFSTKKDGVLESGTHYSFSIDKDGSIKLKSGFDGTWAGLNPPPIYIKEIVPAGTKPEDAIKKLQDEFGLTKEHSQILYNEMAKEAGLKEVTVEKEKPSDTHAKSSNEEKKEEKKAGIFDFLGDSFLGKLLIAIFSALTKSETKSETESKTKVAEKPPATPENPKKISELTPAAQAEIANVGKQAQSAGINFQRDSTNNPLYVIAKLQTADNGHKL